MPSLVELVFAAVGTEAAAGAVEGVSGKLADMTRELGRMATAAVGLGVVLLDEGDAPARTSSRRTARCRRRTSEARSLIETAQAQGPALPVRNRDHGWLSTAFVAAPGRTAINSR